MDQPTSSQNTTHVDRRRYQRQKPASILYAALDSSNGGIILDLGMGGLAFQAADKLSVQEDLTFKFRLSKTGPSVEIVGGIAWLAPTQKEAGIYFKNLSSDARQEITSWIARQDKKNEAIGSAPPSVSRRMVFSSATAAISRTADSGATTAPEADPKAAPATRPAAIVESAKPTGPEPARPAKPPGFARGNAELRKDEGNEAVPKRQWVLPTSLGPSRVGGATHEPRAPAPAAAQAQAQPRNHRSVRNLAFVGATVGLAALALIFVVAYIAGSQGDGSVPQGPQTPTESAAPDDSHAPIPPGQPSVRSGSNSSWTAYLRHIIPGAGDSGKAPLTRDQANVRVWISTRSGYYYCSGSPDYGSAQPGATMTQGEALQSGYQPKLGDICN